jgi:hypothetical protein
VPGNYRRYPPLPEPEPTAWADEHSVRLLITQPWTERELTAFYEEGGITLAALLKAIVELVKDKIAAERERLARDQLIDGLIRRAAQREMADDEERKQATIEIIATLRGLKGRPVETLASFQRKRGKIGLDTRQEVMKAWLERLAEFANRLRADRLKITDTDILIEARNEKWPVGEDRLRKGMTILNKEKRITPRRRDPKKGHKHAND